MLADFVKPAEAPPGADLAPGLLLYRAYLSDAAQRTLGAEIRGILQKAPWFTPRMPRSGRPFSVKMTNCGTLGWVSDVEGYRYEARHPVTGRPWPAIPASVLEIWRAVSGCPHPPEACLINFYAGQARMGLHQDRDEGDFAAPVLSISLGDRCTFRYGGLRRSDTARKVELHSGDVLVMGGPSRLIFHGVDKIHPGTSDLWPAGGRINLTLRRVTKP